MLTGKVKSFGEDLTIAQIKGYKIFESRVADHAHGIDPNRPRDPPMEYVL